MFDVVIEKNVNSILSKIKSLNDFGLDCLIDNPHIDDKYKNMFIAERDIWIYKEKLKLSANPFFDFSMGNRHRDIEFDTYLKEVAKIPYNDLTGFIRSLVKLRLNFLCRPRTTLRFFIFKESLTLPHEEFLKYFAYFTDYDYLFQNFYDYIAAGAESGTNQISIYEFDNLIKKFDDIIVLDMDSKSFLDLLSPLFEFYSVGYPSDINLTAHSMALSLFFDDKNMKYVSALLQTKYLDKCISKSELISILGEILAEDNPENNEVLARETEAGEENFADTRNDSFDFEMLDDVVTTEDNYKENDLISDESAQDICSELTDEEFALETKVEFETNLNELIDAINNISENSNAEADPSEEISIDDFQKMMTNRSGEDDIEESTELWNFNSEFLKAKDDFNGEFAKSFDNVKEDVYFMNVNKK